MWSLQLAEFLIAGAAGGEQAVVGEFAVLKLVGRSAVEEDYCAGRGLCAQRGTFSLDLVEPGELVAAGRREDRLAVFDGVVITLVVLAQTTAPSFSSPSDSRLGLLVQPSPGRPPMQPAA